MYKSATVTIAGNTYKFIKGGVTRMSMNRISHPSEVVAVGDIVQVYVIGVDEVKEKVQLSLLPPADLERREAMIQQNRNRRQNRGRKPDNARCTEQKVQKKEPVTMEDATARLLERFGKKH